MHFIVCVKQVPDPEIPPAKFKIDEATKKVIPPPGVPPVISVFDERAVEAACRLKDKNPGSKITAITMGPGKVVDVVKHAISMGADEGVVLQDPAFENLDSFGTAYVLSKAIQKIGQYDMVLCGRQAADWGEGQVGSILAEMLGIPVITLASDVQAVDSKARVKRIAKDGLEVVEAPLPALVTVSSEIGLPRLPAGMRIMIAARKQVPVWKATDIQTDPARLDKVNAHAEVKTLFVPLQKTQCEYIKADTVANAAVELAVRISKMV